MGYKIQEQAGNWIVIRESENIRAGGDELTYEQYKLLRANPQEVANHFRRDSQGHLVAKVKKKAT